MDPLIIQKFSDFQKQSAVGSIVLFFQSLRKNSFNFIYLLFPAIKGNVKISIFLFLGFVILIAFFAYIKYYYFKYKFDFEKSTFIIYEGFLEKTNLSILRVFREYSAGAFVKAKPVFVTFLFFGKLNGNDNDRSFLRALQCFTQAKKF